MTDTGPPMKTEVKGVHLELLGRGVVPKYIGAP